MSEVRSVGSGMQVVAIDAPLPSAPRSSGPAPAGIDPRLRAVLAGDRAAATSLARELLPRVRNLARFLVRGDAEIDDIAQDATLAIMKALPSFRGESAFQTWYERITVRIALKHARRNRRFRTQPIEAFDERNRLTAPIGTADLYLARRALVQILDSMPVEQREAVVLHHVLGMSAPELAETLGIPFETARSRVRLGMLKLREYFGLESHSDE
jgi:RNA polymerase sigma-70 factor, ECF subfamily